MRLSRAAAKYVQWKQARGPRFIKGTQVLQGLLHNTGDISLERISPRTISEYLDGSRMAPDTWWRIYQMLRSFFQFWVARGAIMRSPMPRPRAALPPPFRPYIFTKADMRRLLHAIAKDIRFRNVDPLTLRAAVLLIYGTGALVEEMLNLQSSDIDFNNSTIVLHRTSRGLKRVLPIAPGLSKELRHYIRSTATWRNNRSQLLVSKRVARLPRAGLGYNFRRLCLRIGLHQNHGISRTPGMHDLRHTFAVHSLEAWLRSGKDIEAALPVLSGYMGHVMPRSTEQYLRLVPGRFRAQLAKLGPPEKPANVQS